MIEESSECFPGGVTYFAPPVALITGITGFVGSHLTEYLLANTDWRIRGLHRWDDSLDNLQGVMPEINRNGRVVLVRGDLNDAGSLVSAVSVAKPDYVFHLAAQSYVQASLETPATTLQTNTVGTLNLLEAIRRHAPNAWIHNCSSSEVYGRVPPSQTPIKEGCPFAPSSPYSISKVGADLLGRYYAEAYGLKVLTTRMFTHTGPRRGDVFAESSFAKQIAMIDAGQLEPPIKVGNLSSSRTVADVRDAVRAYHMLLTIDPQAGEVYNIGGTHTCTVGSILREIMCYAKVTHAIKIDLARLRPLDADHQIPDCSKFTAHTGWRPEIPFKQTMADLLQFWRGKVKVGVPLQR